MTDVLRLKPFYYIHVLDTNKNQSRVEIGPLTYTRSEHEKVVYGPVEMVKIPPRNYVKVSNPAIKDSADASKVVLDNHGNVKLRFGEEEIRFEQEPFVLYPGETLVQKITPLQVVPPDTALVLQALRDFVDENKIKRLTGDSWLFKGCQTYIPRVEVKVAKLVEATIINTNQALRLRALKDLKDSNGADRKVGEEWLMRSPGAYIPNIDEKIVEVTDAIILTDKVSLHLKARRTFIDFYKQVRKAGEEWLITFEESPVHIIDVDEMKAATISRTVLTALDYCYISDPWANGKNQFGKVELRRGPITFFLQPGETMSEISRVYILGEDEALLLSAKLSFKDEHVNAKGEAVKIERHPGDRWMIYGPRDYVPPVEAEVVAERHTIALDTNEGVYVRDTRTGKVRAVIGKSYLLQPHEELWEKELAPTVRELLEKNQVGEKTERSSVVTYQTPHNTAVQIYDYKDKKSRVVFGPDLVMLGPDEQFTLLSLSGGTPKKPHQLKVIALSLGPDFMTEVIKVETSDHARLALQLSFNWNFAVDKTDLDQAQKLFVVPDFVGDACKAISSKVRGAVASSTFDEFHRGSAKIIRSAVFGNDESGKVNPALVFPNNNLTITNVDIQSVEPIDHRTRDSLQKSVQLAIEITTNSQEANAKHEAQRIEQEAKARLERQKITDQSKCEEVRRELAKLQALSATVVFTGQTTAEARARTDAAEIESRAAVLQAKLLTEAKKIEAEEQLRYLEDKRRLEIEHTKKMDKVIARSHTFFFSSSVSDSQHLY
eukprot:TRINITY_DN477_c0_g1_i2.p1 TRINITY_DN477_c0_g1~~TRINITY_DN477_c0_g1_i2.p1  ORF type:complete len:775 (-),score=391.50 TRINITY_DN477_c0_g1_i2:22-2346(-)